MKKTNGSSTFYSKDLYEKYEKELYEKGYVVVKGVISKEKAKDYEGQFFDWLEGLNETKIDRNDPSTWKGDQYPMNLHGIFKQYAIGHIQPIWEARVEPGIHEFYKNYWKSQDLLTSYDGACLLRPKMGEKFQKEWFHTDQGAYLRATKAIQNKIGDPTKFMCLQGILNLRENGDKDGGLMVLEGSHKSHEKFYKDTNQKDYKDNWYIYSRPPKIEGESEEDYNIRANKGKEYIESHKKVKINCEAGDAVFFFSRTAHCIAPTESDNHRLVFYISMLPKAFATETDIKKKRNALETLRTTSHWACINIKLNPKQPRTYGKEVPEFKLPDPPKLNGTMKKLAGFKEDEKIEWKVEENEEIGSDEEEKPKKKVKK